MSICASGEQSGNEYSPILVMDEEETIDTFSIFSYSSKASFSILVTEKEIQIFVPNERF